MRVCVLFMGSTRVSCVPACLLPQGAGGLEENETDESSSDEGGSGQEGSGSGSLTSIKASERKRRKSHERHLQIQMGDRQRLEELQKQAVEAKVGRP